MRDKLKSKRILFVDDEELIIDIYQTLFSGCFESIDVAFDGREAVELFNQKKHDIIVSDIKMPQYDGIYLYEQFKKLKKGHEKFIFISGFSTLSREDALAMGVSEIFSKPCDMDELLDYIASFYADEMALESKGN
jgi:YesN/AraC family two-component response regulator